MRTDRIRGAAVIIERIDLETKLTGISMGAYQKIRQYIEKIIEEDNGDNANPESKNVSAPEKDVAQKMEVQPKQRPPRNELEVKRNQQNKGSVLSIIREAEENPDKFTWEWRSIGAWKKCFNNFAGIKSQVIEKEFRLLVNSKLVDIREGGGKYNPKEYMVPVPRSGSKEKKALSQDEINGQILKKERIEKELTQKDLADLISYDIDVIKRWESGEYAMSSEAKNSCELLFNKKMFA